MNIPDYITSGILESYALGTVSDQERREVECLSGIYPEVRQELDRLTLALENYALLHSVEPPTDMQERIRARLTMGPPAAAPTTTQPEAKVMPLHRERPIFQSAWMAAAAVGLALIIFSYYLISQLRGQQSLNSGLTQKRDSLQTEVVQLQQQQQRTSALVALLQQPGMETVRLAAARPGGARANVLVYWNRPKQVVTVEIASLPTLPPNQQYQLWALVGGKPVDAGVLTTAADSTALQQTNRAIATAEQFAITIEKAGGSPTPTLSALVAVGKVG
jgi:anti-sigma-K factor RskA